MNVATSSFSVRETHGILWRPDKTVRVSSEDRGWTSLYASVQREAPYEGRFDPVEDYLIVVHLDGPVPVAHSFGGVETQRVIPPGSLVMMPGGVGFGVRLGGALDTLHLYVRRAVIEEVAADLVRGDPGRVEFAPRVGGVDPLLEHLALGVRDALDDCDPAASVYVDYMARAIAARLVRGHSSACGEMPRRLAPKRHALEPALEFMRANLDRTIGLPAIAASVALSPSHFARAFRAATGVAPHRFLMELRVERAKRLLADADCTIAEVAAACGFAHQEHLTRRFRQACGTTPAAWRRARRA